jgi:hypothetical protein
MKQLVRILFMNGESHELDFVASAIEIKDREKIDLEEFPANVIKPVAVNGAKVLFHQQMEQGVVVIEDVELGNGPISFIDIFTKADS